MKKSLQSTGLLLAALCFSACASQGGTGYDPDHQKKFVLGAATDRNIALQSIRAVDVPNSKGLSGQSGERAVSAITRLNSGERTELSDISSSGIGSTSSE